VAHQHRRTLLRLVGAVALALTAPALATGNDLVASPSTADSIALEDFTAYPLGSFPHGWKVRGRLAEAAAVYRVSEDGAGIRFLAARAEGQSVMVGLEQPFEPARYPYLRWQWRVRRFPSGGDERAKATNDSAAGVYVVFRGRLPFLPRVLKYVWSAGAPVGVRQSSPTYGDTKIIVIASGPARAPDEWRMETVNVQADYTDLFGRAPSKVRGIGVLTDANDTESIAAADYAGFQLLNAEPQPDNGTAKHNGKQASNLIVQ
jgi:hypothetical protein